MSQIEYLRREAEALRIIAARLDRIASPSRRSASAVRTAADRLDGLANDLEDAPPWGSEFFTLEELSCTSQRLPNDPCLITRQELAELCRVILDPLRRHLGKPITVTSGYRSQTVNAAVGGAPRSDHVKGRAADIKVRGMTALDLAAAVVAIQLPFRQLITYDDKGHVHVSYYGTGTPKGQQLRHVGGTYERWDHSK